MRRSEIIEGVQQVLEAIVESKITENFEAIIRRRDETDSSIRNAMESIKRYFIKAQKFNFTARQIVSILELDDLENPSLWISIAGDDGAPTAHIYYSTLKFARNYLPKVTQLLNREYSSGDAGKSEPIISNGKEMKILSVTVFESNNRLSSPQRLVNVLESVDSFYSACAYIHQESPNTLSVIGCDSGSDKSFDFLGVAKVIECVTQLIENLWDRIVFYREKQVDARLDLINKSLPIYEKLNELETTKKIEPELAERLRRNISDGVNKFVESGASIPEIDANSTHSSRSLLTPVQKLLVSAPEETEQDGAQQNTRATSTILSNSTAEQLDFDNLSSGEKHQLSELMNKMKQAPKTEIVENDYFEDGL